MTLPDAAFLLASAIGGGVLTVAGAALLVAMAEGLRRLDKLLRHSGRR